MSDSASPKKTGTGSPFSRGAQHKAKRTAILSRAAKLFNTKGAIDWLVSEDSLAGEAKTLIEKFTRLAPMSLAAMLRVIKMVETNTFDKAEAQALADGCSGSEDLQEGLRAQREKRAPRFNRR